jgi:hypothetical protein
MTLHRAKPASEKFLADTSGGKAKNGNQMHQLSPYQYSHTTTGAN